MDKSKVYFTKEITSESLVRIFDALGKDLKGKVAVKISTGEKGGNNYLKPELIKDLVNKLNGTIVECNTAYGFKFGGKRDKSEEHLEVIKEHGFFDIAEVDLMDKDGEFEIPLEGGFHLDKDIVGKNLSNYDSMLVLSHFKGHAVGGFGGALKNVAIGVASSSGKAYIHSAGVTSDMYKVWDIQVNQDDFLESMADANKAVEEYLGKDNMIYINVANRLSVDCDCSTNPAEPEMADIGIFASIDPVAIDQASVDAVYNSTDSGKKALIERMESRHGIHTIEAAYQLGLGNRNYELIDMDK